MKYYLLPIVILLLTSICCAEDISVTVRSRIDPESAVGLLISAGGTVEKAATKISKNDHGDTVVSFAVEKDEIDPSTLASAIIKGKDGAVAFAEVAVLKSAANTATNELCMEEDRVPQAMLGQLGLLQALVQKRAERRAIGKEKIKLMLNEQMLKKFQQFEQVFGISEATALDSSASPYDLIDRLSRLEAAIRTYKANNEYKLQVKRLSEPAALSK